MSILLRLQRGVGDLQTTWGNTDAVREERNVAFASQNGDWFSRPPESTAFLPLRINLLKHCNLLIDLVTAPP